MILLESEKDRTREIEREGERQRRRVPFPNTMEGFFSDKTFLTFLLLSLRARIPSSLLHSSLTLHA
jgi:hypothetical protein